jgi:ABC-type branched-subunit amino acid transport system substrate-binding protein/DNA-binding beta-propeller fold protein YncE
MGHIILKSVLIAVEESDSTVAIYDLESDAELTRIKVGFWPHEVALSADGQIAYVSNFGLKDYDEHIGTPGFSISVIDLQYGVEKERLYTFSNPDEFNRLRAPHGLRVSPDGKRLFVNVETEHHMLIFDLTQQSKVPRRLSLEHLALDRFSETEDYPLPTDAHNFLLSDSGDALWVYPSRRGVSKVDARTGATLANYAATGVVRGLAFSHDKKTLFACEGGRVSVLDPDTLVVLCQSPDFAAAGEVRQFLYPGVTPDGRLLLCPAVWEGKVWIFDARTLEVVSNLQVGLDPIHLCVTDDSKFAYVSHGRSFYALKIDLHALAVSSRIPTRGGPNGIALTKIHPVPRKEKLVFGACLPLSGGSSAEGRDLYLGYQYWQEQTNAAGGLSIGDCAYEVQLAIRDTRSSVAESDISGLTSALIEQDRISFLFGTYPSPPNLYCARSAASLGIPLVTASGAANMIYEQGLENVFGIMSPANGFLVPTLRWLASSVSPRPKTLTICSCQDPAALGDARTTIEAARTMGFEIVVLENTGFSTDPSGAAVFAHLNGQFGQFIAVARDARPDVLIQTGHLPESVALVREAAAQNFTPMGLIFSVGPALWGFADQLGPLAQHMIGAAMWSSMQQSYGQDPFVLPNEFAKAFFGRYSMKASYLAAGAYACGLLYQRCLRRAASTEPAAIRRELSRTQFDSFYSHIEFNDYGLNEHRPVITIQLRKFSDGYSHVPVWPRDISGGTQPVWPFVGWPSL